MSLSMINVYIASSRYIIYLPCDKFITRDSDSGYSRPTNINGFFNWFNKVLAFLLSYLLQYLSLDFVLKFVYQPFTNKKTSIMEYRSTTTIEIYF